MEKFVPRALTESGILISESGRGHLWSLMPKVNGTSQSQCPGPEEMLALQPLSESCVAAGNKVLSSGGQIVISSGGSPFPAQRVNITAQISSSNVLPQGKLWVVHTQ